MPKSTTAVVAALLMLLGACQSGEPTTPDTSAKDGSLVKLEVPTQLIYVKGRRIMAHDLEERESKKLATLATPDAEVSPDGTRYVFVDKTRGGRGRQNFVKYRLHLSEVGGRNEPLDLGPGRAPEWAPNGEEVAAVTRARGYLICPSGDQDEALEGNAQRAGCRQAERVVAYEVGAGASSAGSGRVLLGADLGWSILGWTDGERVAAIASSGRVMISSDENDEPPVVGFSPSEIWGISPTDLTLLIVQEGRSYFATPGEGTSPAVPLKGRRLGDGNWAPDGTKVAIQLIGGSEPRLGLLDVGSAELTLVPYSEGAQGNVVWAEDGSFAYVRVHPRAPRRSQAVVCSARLNCAPLFSWAEGVSLLALTRD